MRRALLLCILLLFGATVWPALLSSVKGATTALPELSIVPDDIFFTVDDSTTEGAVVGTPLVNITVYVDNSVEDNITSANVTASINGTLLGVSPLITDFAGEEGLLGASFSWNTSTLPVGVYPVRAQVNDSAGDQYPENNAAQTNFTIVPGPPSLKMELDPAIVQAAVTDWSPGIARINGTLSVSDLYGLPQLINLNCHTDIGWKSSIGPVSLIAAKDGNYSFDVYVTVPLGSSADIMGRLSVSAVLQWPGANLSVSAEATVTVSQFFRVQLSSEKPFLEIAPGDECTFAVNLYNQGNGNDSFFLELVNQDELAKDHSSATLSCLTVKNLGPDKSAAFKIFFKSAKDWTLSKDAGRSIGIKVTSLGAQAHQENISTAYFLSIHEKGSYPAWYNWTTIDMAVIVLVVVIAAGFWNWRRKRKKTGEPENRQTG